VTALLDRVHAAQAHTSDAARTKLAALQLPADRAAANERNTSKWRP
jgi:hypothetical protein